MSGLFESAKGKGSADEVELEELVLVAVELEVMEELEEVEEAEELFVEEDIDEVLVVDMP